MLTEKQMNNHCELMRAHGFGTGQIWRNEMTNQTDLTELHSAMVECGIWPDEIYYYAPDMAWYYKSGGPTNGPILYLHVVHIMRGVSEEWFVKHGGMYSNRGGMYYEVWKKDMCEYGGDSLPAALRYATSQKALNDLAKLDQEMDLQ